MATLPSLNSNKELKQDVEAWCLEQPEKLTAAEVAKQFPDLKNYNVRSVNKIVGNAFKHAHDLQNAMDRKRTADTMMEVARSGTHLAKSVSAATEGEVHSPPEHRRMMVSPNTLQSAEDLYEPYEIRLDTWVTQWKHRHHNGHDVETRIGMNVGANSFLWGENKPSVKVIREGTVLEIKSKLPPIRDVEKLDIVYEGEIETLMESKMMDTNVSAMEKKIAVAEMTALNARKLHQIDAFEEDRSQRQDAWDYGVTRIRLLETCEVTIPKKKIKGSFETGWLLDIDLKVKKEKTYKGSEAVDASPVK